MSKIETRQITDEEDGQRLDRWLKQNYPDLPFGRMQKLLRSGQIRLDGGRVKGNARLGTGQALRLPPELSGHGRERESRPLPEQERQEIAHWILCEDEHILLVNKPAGLASQGGSGTYRHLDGLLKRYYGGDPAPKLCHRLDRDTSGVMLLAKTREAAQKLTHDFKIRAINKDYLAITLATPQPYQGEIRGALRKSGSVGQERMVIDEVEGKSARSLYVTLDHAGPERALLALRPLTGRTHQLRVHLQAIGAAILGDHKYTMPERTDGLERETEITPDSEIEDRLYLHAWRLSFQHPHTGENMQITAPPPEDFKATMRFFGLVLPPVEEDPFGMV